MERCICNSVLCSQILRETLWEQHPGSSAQFSGSAHRCFVRLFGSRVQAPPRSPLGASVLRPRLGLQSAVAGPPEAPVTFLGVCLGPACAREGVCAECPFLLESMQGAGACGGDRTTGSFGEFAPPRHGLFATVTAPLNWGARVTLLPCLPVSLPAAPPVGAGVWCSVVGTKGFENQDEQNNRTQAGLPVQVQPRPV